MSVVGQEKYVWNTIRCNNSSTSHIQTIRADGRTGASPKASASKILKVLKSVSATTWSGREFQRLTHRIEKDLCLTSVRAHMAHFEPMASSPGLGGPD